MNIIWQAFKKSFVFEGRASRKEFWCFTLFVYLILFGCVVVDIALHKLYSQQVIFAPAVIAGCVLTFFPSLAVLVRRFHDTNRSGWYWFMGMIPVAGLILHLVALLQAGTPGDNDYGPAPGAAMPSES